MKLPGYDDWLDNYGNPGIWTDDDVLPDELEPGIVSDVVNGRNSGGDA